jgi:hypothetical protein
MFASQNKMVLSLTCKHCIWRSTTHLFIFITTSLVPERDFKGGVFLTKK